MQRLAFTACQTSLFDNHEFLARRSLVRLAKNTPVFVMGDNCQSEFFQFDNAAKRTKVVEAVMVRVLTAYGVGWILLVDLTT